MSATIVACMKWVSTQTDSDDDRFAGISAADQAALEFALRHGELTGTPVTAITLGPAGAERAMREALACGASHAIHLLSPSAMASAATAQLLAAYLSDAVVVWCGDMSDDRGTGSVPAFLAAALGAQQALGAVQVGLDVGLIDVLRRLDGGRRERLRVTGPAVISVEGGVVGLRRAGLRASLAARDAYVERIEIPRQPESILAVTTPYRPRAMAVAGPAGERALDRIRDLLHSQASAPARAEVVELDPPAAAQRIISTLIDWGYLST
ncbi:MAG TPA: hypothetical protein PKV27_01185 [Ilumatobacteraceae bacterium]|nr:hypothetical protein [Ilumatobacteraceae bacterium]